MVQIGLRGMQRNKGNEFKGCKLGQSRSGGAQLANQVGLGGFDFEALLSCRAFWDRALGCKGHAQADDHGHQAIHAGLQLGQIFSSCEPVVAPMLVMGIQIGPHTPVKT
jgi:hypothetical protein